MERNDLIKLMCAADEGEEEANFGQMTEIYTDLVGIFAKDVAGDSAAVGALERFVTDLKHSIREQILTVSEVPTEAGP